MYPKAVGYKWVKTEHAGAKNGGGAWMTRAEAKESARRKRRQADEEVVEGGWSLDDWGDLDQFSAHASRGVLHHMTEDEEAAGLSWDTFRPGVRHREDCVRRRRRADRRFPTRTVQFRSPSPWIGWTTWSPVSSGFQRIESRWDRLESVGHVAPFVAPEDPAVGSDLPHSA